jgi:ketosteroid isomerase-like protein
MKEQMTENKKTIEKYMDGFRKSDHEQILSCLTENVVWEMPGVYYHTGKKEFDKEIENDAFTGSPEITIIRLIEENGVVAAEGKVKAKRKDGGFLNAVFCDVFIMKNGKIDKLTSYLMQVNKN